MWIVDYVFYNVIHIIPTCKTKELSKAGKNINTSIVDCLSAL